ncbi:flagellar biosynthesis protein FliO [Neorhizobium lilium]|uniref:Flagellar biosynthesis protein FliO n=1 Tax=Neorhizobium lilium TaxID=2503024 RepID=A0A3S4UJX0_9HYPH|nr:flagellar biosynthetic protein FliO [Neorhizobium lilium]RWX75488.1 flagellar biosynthesis protein FliO [Neorhizobium lilium]
MIEELMGAYGGRLVIAVIGVAIGLVCLIGILWLLRGRNGPSPFVRGGRNRNPRLQVLDAAAVDTRRRLVLVRRDDVEHLIMIGGPTDIVVESGIRTGSPVRAPVEATAPTAPIGVSDLRSQAPARLAAPVAEPRLPAREPPRQPTLSEDPAREAALRPAPRAVSAPAAPPSPEPRPEPRLDQGPAQRVTPSAVVAQRSEPAAPPAIAATRSEPASSPAAKMPASSATPPSPAVNEAANALDAARGRVLQERPEPPKIVPVGAAAAAQPALQQAAEKPKILGSDFEQILEEEMASNLAGREAPAISPAAPQVPPRDARAAPIITGATAEPSLQDEVARIFGEMSVTRDK